MIRVIFSILFACLLVVGYSVAQQVSVSPSFSGLINNTTTITGGTAPNQILIDKGGTLGESGCTIDSTNSESCSSATTALPVMTLQNTTADANTAILILKKQRGVGNVNANDNIGTILFNAASGSITPTMGQLQVGFTQHTNGTNTITAGTTTLTSWDENNSQNVFVQSGSGNHLGLTTAAAHKPSVSGCGGSPGSVAGNDTWGQVTEGSAATGCTINFGGVWSSTPTCVVSISASAITLGISTSNTGGTNSNGTLIASHASATGAQLFWHCNEST